MNTKFLLIVTGIVAMLSGCGGGGGSDEGTNDSNGNEILLPNYAYSISALPGGTNPFTVTIGQAVIGVDSGNTITGTVEVGSTLDDKILLTNRTVAAGSTFSVNSDLGIQTFGSFDVTVVNELAFAFEDPPTVGVLEVAANTENIRITVVSAGVQISLNNGQPVPLTWSQFEDLLDDNTAPAWQKRASLAVQALQFVYIRAFDIASVFDLINASLEANIQTTDMCDEFPGVPPGGVAQGMSVLTWLGSGSIQPGDSFRWDFTDCWFDDLTSARDEYLNGGIDLIGYTEVIDNDTITRIGFEPFQASPGGVIFDNFEVQGLVEINPPSGDYSFDAGDPPILNGGFALVFFRQ